MNVEQDEGPTVTVGSLFLTTFIHVPYEGAVIRITVCVENPTSEVLADLDAFLTKHAAVVQTDTTWTPARARDYYEELPARAKTIVREALRRGGRVPADALRTDDGKGLNGHANGLKTTLTKGVEKQLWPHGMQQPILGIGPGYGKVQGYRIRDEALPAFCEGLAHLLDQQGDGA
ncbi:hypothetical protein [Streptomyces sp. A0592]|uniref:hypothetical protein n=1 Tax=Streptomyces sp. A0592 TaxID=2563099 RepID=UPI00109E6DD7|nr:hypothetical protein [Streptomyces sp. A0592]THA77817.1 hypothetical protein E6U81_34185 [Streptomyces sp. A0592]